MRLAAFLAGCAALAAAVPALAEYAPGDSSAAIDAHGTRIEILLYKPPGYRGEGLIVSLHGLGRNVDGYRNYTRALAERLGALLVVPLFDRERFPTWRYQRAGVMRRSGETGRFVLQPAEQWTSNVLRAIVDAVREEEGSAQMPFVLIGHSAGAQSLSRMSALDPLPAARIVIANPSSWLAASASEPFPYGFGGLPDEIAGEQALRRYLALPLTVLLGTADTGSTDLSMTAGAVRQGEHRYARGRNVFRVAEALARARGWSFGWRLIEVPNVGHSARTMYASPLAADALCPDPGASGAWPCRR